MTRERFVTMVEECLGGGIPPGCLASDEAARTCHAVLEALALRLSSLDRRRLAAELPRPLGDELGELDLEEPLPAGDTVGRVARELEVDREVAERRIACVLATLREALRPETYRGLPEDATALGGWHG